MLTMIFMCQLEFFFFMCFENIIFFSKNLKMQKSFSDNQYMSYNYVLLLMNYFFLIFLTTLKVSSESFNMFFLIFITYSMLKLSSVIFNKVFLTKANNKGVELTLIIFSGCLFLYFYLESFLSLFFFIEVYGVLYYFFFLTSYNFTNVTLLKYKTGLLFLLWNNFLTTITLCISCFIILSYFGTTSFCELNVLAKFSNYVYLYLVGISWKIGLPVFHYFKIEMYKYLLGENVFLFSMLTVLINLTILVFMLGHDVVINTLYTHNFVIISVLFVFNMVMVNTRMNNMVFFYAISGVLTLTTFISLFLM